MITTATDAALPPYNGDADIDDVTHRIPPQNAEVEAALLGAILTNISAFEKVADFLRAGLASLADQLGEERPDDIDDIELDEEIADSIVGEENILSGVFLSAKAFDKPTQKGGIFTRIKWGVPENLKEFV